MTTEPPKKKPHELTFKDDDYEGLIKYRHGMVQKSSQFLKSMQGEVWYRLGLILNEYGGISLEQALEHAKKDEIMDKIKKTIDQTLSYSNVLHPLHAYVDSGKLDSDPFIKSLVDQIFTPYKQNILDAVGDKDLESTLDTVTSEHVNALRKKGQQYVFQGFNVADPGVLDQAHKYLGKMGKKIKKEDLAARADKYMGEIYKHIID
ncbi:MAG: hypothetical protein HGA85_06100 [Nanoarchaeota archaeon]|nr:hypothetical protein [Nanoarchaeota archaeon]